MTNGDHHARSRGLALIAALLALGLAGAPAASAAGPLDQSQTALDSTHSYYAYSAQTFAQTFTAGRTGLLDQVTLPLRAFSGGTLTVDVVPVVAGQPVTSGAPLTSATVDSSLAPRYGPVPWVNIALADTLVVAGQQYAIALAAPGSPWQWLGASSPLYAAGGAFFQFPPDPAGAWNPLAYSFGFETYVLPCTSGRVERLRVPAGSTACLNGAHVAGPTTLGAGSSLIASDSSFGAAVRGAGAASVRMCSSQVDGPVRVEQAGRAVVIGDGAACAGNRIDGPVDLVSDTGGVTVAGNQVDGSVRLIGDGGAITVSGNTIDGPLRCTGSLTAPGNAGVPNMVDGPEAGDCADL